MVHIRKVKEMLTRRKERDDNVNVCRSRDSLFDKQQKQGNVKYGKDHGASDGIDAIGLSKVVARGGGVSHDGQEQ